MSNVPLCADLDEDCDDLDHLNCFLYDPGKGRCPYLSPKKPTPAELTTGVDLDLIRVHSERM